MYALVYTKEFLKQLKKLDKNIQRRIILSLERIRPHARVKKLVGNPYFRLRVGNYRIIIDILQNQLIIYILEVGHRKRLRPKSKQGSRVLKFLGGLSPPTSS